MRAWAADRCEGEIVIARRVVESADGTRLGTWSNGGTGVPVVISNGLGTPIEAWSSIVRQRDRYRVVTWDYRGLGRSQRPVDERRITVADHANDLRAVMDAYDMPRAVVVGWSVGVNVAFEVARREPHRVAGVLAVAGIPGDSFSALFHPLPGVLRPRAGRIGAQLLRVIGPVLGRLADGLPAAPDGALDVRGLSTLGVDAAHAPTVLHVLRTFAQQDWAWYSRLVKASGEHPSMDLRSVRVPTTFVAGRWDSVASAARVRQVSGQLPDSRYVELAGTHFVPLQYPHAMSSQLTALVARCDLRP